MKNKYCLPIIRERKNDILKVIRANITDYCYFEVWLDYIDNLDDAFIKQLTELLKEKLILLFRRQNLEQVKMKLEKRLEIITLLENSQSRIDLDIFNQKEELDHIKSRQLNIETIVSYHNYKETPDNRKLKKIIDTMRIYKPGILKIATMCKSQQDAVQLLQLLLELKSKNVKYIILGMGQHGMITRIFGTLWGNELIFAPKIVAEKSAKGQLTRNQLDVIFSTLQ